MIFKAEPQGSLDEDSPALQNRTRPEALANTGHATRNPTPTAPIFPFFSLLSSSSRLPLLMLLPSENFLYQQFSKGLPAICPWMNWMTLKVLQKCWVQNSTSESGLPAKCQGLPQFSFCPFQTGQRPGSQASGAGVTFNRSWGDIQPLPACWVLSLSLYLQGRQIGEIRLFGTSSPRHFEPSEP